MEVEQLPFSELLSVVIDNRGRTCPTAEAGIPLIATNCIRNELLYPTYDKVRFVSKETYSSWFRGHPRPGDIIFVNKATPGRVCLVPDPVDFCIAQDMVAVRADPNRVYPNYLFAVLRSPAVQEKIGQMHVGTLIPHFKKGDFDKLLLPIPERKTQEFIGDTYFALSAKIDANRRMNETLEAMARAIFKSWFVDFDPVRAKMEGRKPASMDTTTAALFPDSFEDSELGEIPKGWRVRRLADVCSTQYGHTASACVEPVGPHFLRVMDINKAHWIEWHAVPYCEIPPEQLAKYALRVGDIVVAEMADPGKSAIIDEEVNAVFASYLVRLKVDALADSYYIYGFLKSALYTEYAEGAKSGSVQANMNAQVIVGTELVWPSETCRKNYLATVRPLRQLIVSNIRESAALSRLRDALLPKLLSGEIRVGREQIHEGDTLMPESQATTQEPQVNQSHQAEADTLEPFRHSPFTEPVAELEKLLSQSQRVFLMGAGCSKCAGLPLMPELTKAVLDRLAEQPKSQAVLQGLTRNFDGSTQCTIEDYMSELVDLVCIADRRELRGAQDATVPLDGQAYSAGDLLESLAAIKDAIADSIAKAVVKIDVHRQFVRAVHDTLLSGKSGSVRQVDYFTLNYDTLLEDALALERTPLADGFNGGVTGWWDAGGYRDCPVEARVFKIHGSIDWCLCDTDVLPRRVRHGLPVDGKQERVLIWPASTKYRETQRDPYAQILDFMRHTLRPPKNAEVVLTICGYAFGDAHINVEVDRALHESEGRLTVVAFTSDDEPIGQLKEWLNDSTVREQVRIHTNRGFFHADSQRRSEGPLLWWQFETLTRLLGGQR